MHEAYLVFTFVCYLLFVQQHHHLTSTITVTRLCFFYILYLFYIYCYPYYLDNSTTWHQLTSITTHHCYYLFYYILLIASVSYYNVHKMLHLQRHQWHLAPAHIHQDALASSRFFYYILLITYFSH